jgi:dihydrofolate reductase
MKEKYKELFQKIEISLIVAVSENGVIGKGNELPWRLKGELKHFKDTTMGHTVVVGRKTFESMPPLNGRTTAVVSHDFMQYSGKHPDAVWCPDLPAAIYAPSLFNHEYEKCFIAGGSSIYAEAFRLNLLDKLIITHVKGTFDGDAFFSIPEGWSPTEQLNETDQYTIKVWEKDESN